MRNVVIVDSVRTGLAKSFRGGFNQTRADNMTAHLVDALLERNPGLDPAAVEDRILGCGAPEGAQGHNIARNVAVLSKLPIAARGSIGLPVMRCTQLLKLTICAALAKA